jgi:hypothetical protein
MNRGDLPDRMSSLVLVRRQDWRRRKRKIFVIKQIAAGRNAPGGSRCWRILVFDDHPASLRLARIEETAVNPAKPHCDWWEYVVAAVVLLGGVTGMFWLLF